MLVEGEFVVPKMSKKKSSIKMYIKVRSGGRASIPSVPLKQLIWLSLCPDRSWEFNDDWLILEATKPTHVGVVYVEKKK